MGFLIGRTGPKPPCTPTCPEREAECHSTCEKWLIYEKKRMAYHKEVVERGYGRPSSESMVKAIDKKAKRKRLGKKYV
jgi:hypothetical protein